MPRVHSRLSVGESLVDEETFELVVSDGNIVDFSGGTAMSIPRS